MDKKLIEDAANMVKNIPATDVLVPLQQEDENLTPLPKVEYKIIESPTMDKLVRDVNSHLENGWVCDGGVQVSNGTSTRFYQSMERWVVQGNPGPEPEMPSKNSEAECLGPQAGPLGEGMSFLNDEPDLYEDIDKNVDE